MRAKSVLTLVLALQLGGCATVENGPMQRVRVESSPPQADVRMEKCGLFATKFSTTPSVVWVNRRATQCRLVVSLEGYETQTVALRRHLSQSLWSYVEAGTDLCDGGDDCNSLTDFMAMTILSAMMFVPSIIVDTALGAIFEQDRDLVEITFEPRGAWRDRGGSEPPPLP